MKKIFVFLLMTVATLSIFSEEVTPFSVAVWINSGVDTYDTRIQNEFSRSLIDSPEWSFRLEEKNTDNADFHVIIQGMDSMDGTFAWAVAVCPIKDPTFVNTKMYWSEDSITGMNYIARESVKFIEEMLYFMYDYYNANYNEGESSSPSV